MRHIGERPPRAAKARYSIRSPTPAGAAARQQPVTRRAGAPWRADVVAKRCRCAPRRLRAWLLV